MNAPQRFIDRPIISADSHVMEPPDTYIDRIAHQYRDTAPRVEKDPARGYMYVVLGMKSTFRMGLFEVAGNSAF